MNSKVLSIFLGFVIFCGCSSTDSQPRNPSDIIPVPTGTTLPQSINIDGATLACKKIVFVKANYSQNINPDIFIACDDGSQITKLTDDPVVDTMPVWSPDGEKIAFSSNRTGTSQIYIMDQDGSLRRQITFDYSNDWPVWLPDAKFIAFRTTDAVGLWWWRLLDLETNEIQNLTEPNYDFFYQKLAWSPDGKSIASMSMEEQKARNDGSSQIHIQSIGNKTEKILTDNNWANILPAWSPDSQKIAFLSEMHGEYNIYALYIINSDGTGLRQLTEALYTDTGVHYSWSQDSENITIGDYNIGRITTIDLVGGGSAELLVTLYGETVFWPEWQPKGY